MNMLYVNYIWKISYILTNYGDKNVTFVPGVDGPQFILVPSIEGWQERLKYIVLINSVDKSSLFKKVSDINGNYRLICSTSLTINPQSSINITFIQYVRVPWTPMGINILRKRLDLRKGRRSTFNDIPKDMFNIYLKSYSYWNTSDNRYRWDLVNKTLTRILKDVKEEEILGIVSRIVNWVERNINDTSSGNIVKWPSKTIQEKRGGCGDQAVLISTFLRLKNIPSYIYSCIVYMPGRKIYNSSSFIIYHRNVVQHMFSVFYLPNVGWVPIDTTFYDKEKGPLRGAAINLRDNIIIYGKIVYSNPNMFDIVSLPGEGTKIILYKELKASYPYPLLLGIFLTTGAIVLLIVLISKKIMKKVEYTF